MIKNLKVSRKVCIILAVVFFLIASFFVINLLNNSYAHSNGAEIPALQQVNVIKNDSLSAAAKTDLVEIEQYIPGIVIDIRYASENNIHGQRIYDDATAYLRKGTADKLQAVQEDLIARGYGLKIWDAYRPPHAQFKLWEICPDNRYVANPYNGYSNHSRGCTVDVTLVDRDGQELEMPSSFDDFSRGADRDYGDVSSAAAANSRLLEDVMKKYGFTTISSEWWHFDDIEKNLYEVVKTSPQAVQVTRGPEYEDWQAGNYQPSWLVNDDNSRHLVEKAVDQGLISGYSKGEKHYLNLNRYMTRAEFAVMLARVLHLDIEKNQGAAWYQPYVVSLEKAGIINTGNWSSNEWNQYIKRKQMVQWAGKALLVNKYQSGTWMIPNLKSDEIRVSIAAGLISGDAGGNYNWENRAERIHGTIVLMKMQQVLNLSPVISTTSYRPPALEREIIISAIGDCTLGTDPSFPYVGRFDTTLKAVGHDYAYFFSNVRTVLENDYLTIANLETTFTNARKKADKGHQGAAFFFKGDPSYTEILKQGSIEAVNLANNHSYDYLWQGYQDTMDNLSKAGIMFFGYDKRAITTINGIKVGMLGYNVLGRLEEGANIGGIQKQIATDIQEMKQFCPLVIVSFHWGIEGSGVVSKSQSALGHFVIDNGADLVLGHHPHVIQRIENYKDRFIVYSLGNFCFGGNHNPRDKDTFIFQQTFVFNEDDICTDASQVNIIPCSISSVSNRNNFCPTVVEGENAKRILQRLGIPAN
jgi:D-alanyl-D-alanine dipeptidase/poly-gamma-glutamate capsule biosynthesis protein CapA/YwtB (metallophosphatase superfamily)